MSQEQLRCPCGQALGQLHASGNWIIYPNPLLCPACGADNSLRLREHLLAPATKRKRRKAS